MIDDPEKTELLISTLQDSLPIEANITRDLARFLMKRTPDMVISPKCNVTNIFYSGDVGGILCGLDIGGAETETPHIVSITHLSFDRRVPLSRTIEAYQRHRIKKLKRQQARGY